MSKHQMHFHDQMILAHHALPDVMDAYELVILNRVLPSVLPGESLSDALRSYRTEAGL